MSFEVWKYKKPVVLRRDGGGSARSERVFEMISDYTDGKECGDGEETLKRAGL